MTKNKTLKKGVAIVIGATGGVGTPVAKRLYEEGMIVVLSARNKEKLEKLANKLGEENVHIFPSDASDMAQVEKLFEFSKKFGDIDLVVAAAGTWKSLDINTSPNEASDIYRKQSKMFLDVAQNVGHIAAQYMKDQKHGGTLIHFSSHAAIKLLPGNLGYSSSKAGARSLVLNMAKELDDAGYKNVRFTDFQPAAMLTASMKAVVAEDKWNLLIPMETISDAIVFIATAPEYVKFPEFRIEGSYEF